MSSRPSRGAARLAAILDALPDALLLVNCNGTVVNANAIALETFEAPGTALVGRGLLDLLPEFDPNRIPGSMRRPDEDEGEARTKPTRMTARRTDGAEFPVEVTSANLEDGRTPYASSFEAAWADHGPGPHNKHYTGDELLMLVVRDLTGTLDTEAELARQQRQTEMILRAASEGVVGVDTDGRVVLVNPSAAQILGYRAGDLGGQELHPLVHHSRADGSSLPFEETPLHDTLRSGRKHRVRAGQVLWAKDGSAVPVAMTTAPVRDGEQLVGAVLTFTDRRPYVALRERHEQLRTTLEEALRGPLDQLRDELGGLASDPAGQLWPEANQILHHLAAGYGRMTTLVDNVLAYQRLQTGREKLRTERVSLDGVVATGVEGAVELIGPGRVQFAVHAPPIEAEVDPERLAMALAHLIADVAGVDATGAQSTAATGDPTIVVAAAQRGEVVRVEVRGPHAGGSTVHEPLVRGIVERHGGVLQTHEVPGSTGASAYVLEVPCAADPAATESAGASGSGTSDTSGTGTAHAAAGTAGEAGHESGDGGLDTTSVPHSDNETTVMPVPSQPPRGTEGVPQASVPAPRQEQPHPPEPTGHDTPSTTGTAPTTTEAPQTPQQETYGSGAVQAPGHGAQPTGRRRKQPVPVEEQSHAPAPPGVAGAPGADGSPGAPVPGAGGQEATPARGTGRRARRTLALPADGQRAQGTSSTPEAAGDRAVQPGVPSQSQPGRNLPAAPQGAAPALPPAGGGQTAEDGQAAGAAIPHQIPPGTGRRARRPAPETSEAAGPVNGNAAGPEQPQLPAVAGGGRRARRLAAARARAAEQAAGQPASQQAFALPPAQADRTDLPQPPGPEQTGDRPHTPPGYPATPAAAPAGPAGVSAPAQQPPAGHPQAAAPVPAPGRPEQGSGTGPAPGQPGGEGEPARTDYDRVAASPILGGGAPPQQVASHHRPHGLPRPNTPDASQPHGGTGTGGISVQTLGRGVPFARPETAAGQPDARPLPAPAIPTTPSTPTPPAGSGRRRKLGTPGGERDTAAGRGNAAPGPQPSQGREFAIGAPDAGAAEGPEPLDGPNGAVEVTDGTGMAVQPRSYDDEMPPEPLDNPRRLLVWPQPDPSTQQALSARGYRPVIVNSREEVDAQIAARPAALFVDPLTGPITRTALKSLREAAVAAEVPVLVTAGLGQATRETAYGADPAVLLKALAPRDSEQHPPRVLLVEENQTVAGALMQALERRGMQAAHAPSDSDAVNVAAQLQPNLVLMDLTQVRRRRAGIIDWLRVSGLLHRTPFVVYTSTGLDPRSLPLLASGEHVLFLAERSTSEEAQSRIVDLLTKIGAH